MQKDMNAGRVTKEYLAVVNGVPDPPNGRISLPLGRSAEDRRIVVVRDDGQQCVTDYEILEVHDDWTLVRCKLHTGRTHQIRVHLATSGWPILGDRVYGTASERIARQALHAWRVTLSHPVTRELVSLTAPLPADVAALVAGPP
jgi:23S rRNA-/tRNA-specific pseudouridylate synthase